ncbi:MAG: ABC transporter ATP-binding protein [Candidatus Levybacteria bacterium]|nr:ABC transporter ATP-binding protein [Candidatus Levybacteria bacterium]
MEEKNPIPAIFTSGLFKSFGSLHAVSDVNLKIKPGGIYALIGPNGAGKTTLIKLITGLLAPTKGLLKVFDIEISLNPVAAKKMFGYIPDDPVPYDFLTGREFLALTGNLKNMKHQQIEKRIESLETIFPIKDVIDQKMGDYSRGNKQKLAFLAGLISEPELLIIDEPIVGLDPSSIEIFGKTLKEFSKNGGTVFFATHILDFAKTYADRVGIMIGGKIVHEEEVLESTSIEKIYQKATELHK